MTYAIWSNERQAWWAANGNGYVTDWRDAGDFGLDRAAMITAGSIPGSEFRRTHGGAVIVAPRSIVVSWDEREAFAARMAREVAA